MSQARSARPFAASPGQARPDGVAKHRTSVFLEHNLVSAVILIVAVAASLLAMGTTASPGTWWTRALHAMSHAASR